MSKFITIYNSEEEVTYELASFGERFGARLLDILIIIIPSALIPLLPAWLYFAFQQSGAAQATVGQKALKIKVVDLNGRKIEFGQATGRFFGNLLNILSFFIGFFMFFFNEKNQCLHDYLSNCVVVKEAAVDRKSELSQHFIKFK